MMEEKAKALGIQEFVMKPFVVKDLAVVICRPWTRRKKEGLSCHWMKFP
jgi:hypothetical protein